MALRDVAFWIKIGLFFLAVVLLFAGDRLASTLLITLGWLVFGVLALLAGAEVIVTREASFTRRRGGVTSGTDRYSGCAAQLWGLMFVLFGAALSLGSLAALAAPEQALAFVDRALEEPWGWGILSVALGAFTAMYGLARVLAGAASTAPSGNRGFRQMGYRLFGGAVLLAGLGMAGIGLVLIAFPEIVLGLLVQVIPGFESR